MRMFIVVVMRPIKDTVKAVKDTVKDAPEAVIVSIVEIIIVYVTPKGRTVYMAASRVSTPTI